MVFKSEEIRYYEFNNRKKAKIYQILKELFSKLDSVKLAYFFGSLIQREKIRDLDIAIYTIPMLTFEELLNLGVQLEIELKLPVDLIQIPDLNASFRSKILSTGKPIIIKDTNLHHILLSQALSEFASFRIAKNLAHSKI